MSLTMNTQFNNYIIIYDSFDIYHYGIYEVVPSTFDVQYNETTYVLKYIDSFKVLDDAESFIYNLLDANEEN